MVGPAFREADASCFVLFVTIDRRRFLVLCVIIPSPHIDVDVSYVVPSHWIIICCASKGLLFAVGWLCYCLLLTQWFAIASFCFASWLLFSALGLTFHVFMRRTLPQHVPVEWHCSIHNKYSPHFRKESSLHWCLKLNGVVRL